MAAERLRLYNSLSASLDEVQLGRDVGLYVCGITPYDAAHLGHAFTYTCFDVLVRLLRSLGHQVTYVQNVTDIDDDILRRAAQVGLDWKELGDREVAKFLRDSDAINNLRPDVMPRATDHIAEMQSIIEGLLARGVAYEREGSVFFEVRRAPTFGQRLFRRPYADQLSTANERGNHPDDPLKRDPLDFVLWQACKPGEPWWESPWGRGRPGWHIECSAMSRRYLGESFDFHGGGADLLFPHHECEIAQSEYGNGAPPARYWLHTAMVHYQGEKMSKSLGNMVFVSDLLAESSSDAIRLALLRHHYRDPWEFRESEMAPARERAALLAAGAAATPGDEADLARWGGDVLGALLDDLDTPRAIEALLRLARSPEAGARRAALRLGRDILGLRLRAE
jgi:L-cysteine:1D-myo-inositol 2-amino-2-deoxy-alpha-D-glucopyranoside ligase